MQGQHPSLDAAWVPSPTMQANVATVTATAWHRDATTSAARRELATLQPAASTHVQDVAGTVVVPLEHRLRGLLRRALRQLDAMLRSPVQDGAAQRKVGRQFQVPQAHAGDRARLVPLRQPPLDAVAVICVAGSKDAWVHLRNMAPGTRAKCRRMGDRGKQHTGACYRVVQCARQRRPAPADGTTTTDEAPPATSP